jgi:hypothetical protein
MEDRRKKGKYLFYFADDSRNIRLLKGNGKQFSVSFSIAKQILGFNIFFSFFFPSLRYFISCTVIEIKVHFFPLQNEHEVESD